MKTIFSLVYKWGDILKVNNKRTSIAVISFSLILILFFLPMLSINFDLGLMSQAGKTKSLIDDYTHKAQNKFSIIFSEKNHSPLTPTNICKIKNITNQLKHLLPGLQVYSPFNLTVPYDEKGKLLFRPLLDINYYDIPQTISFQDFSNYNSYRLYTNINNSDLKIDLALSDNSLSSTQTTKKFNIIRNFISETDLNKNFEIYYSGGPVNLSYIQQILASDLKVNIIFILIFIGLFYLFFKSIRLAGVYLATMLFPMAILIPLYYFFNLSLNPLSGCVFIILAISCIEDFIFLICHKDESQEFNFKKFIEPSFYTSLTTFIGFASLATSEVRDIVGFGLLCALGAMLEWLSVFVFAPSFILFFRAQSINPNSLGLRVLTTISSFRFKSNLIFISFILFGLGIFYGQKMHVDEDLDTLFFKDHQYFKVKKYMAQTGRYEKKLYVMSTDTSLNALKNNLKDENLVESTELYDDYKTDLSKNLTPEVSRFFKDELDDTGLYKLFHIDQFSVAIISLKNSKLSDINYISSKIKKLCPPENCTLFGKNADFAKYSKAIIETLYKSFALSFVLNGIILFALCLYKKQKQFFWVIYTSFWGPVTMFLCLYLLQIPLNFITCIFVSIMLGLTGDNAIQYLFHDSELKEASVEKIGVASLVTATFSIFGSLILGLSGFRFTALLGPIFALGFIINIFGDLFLLKTAVRSPKSNF